MGTGFLKGGGMRNMLKGATILLPLLAVLLGCGTKGGDDGQDPPPLLTGKWTWISGAGNGEPPPAVYGTKGVSDPANVPGGRPGPASWIDAGGKLWLFGGGTRIGGIYNWNDLWRFDPATREWTWMSGSDDINQPGVYGTKGVADPGNVPGARNNSVSWTGPDGKFWLFGGQGGGFSDYFNDLWRFDPATLEWTWIAGSDVQNQPGVYGTKGVADPGNVPGARSAAASWIDPAGKLWLFGGETAYRGRANDLWRFDPMTLEWTWISGTDIMNHGGVYGTKGVADAANVPISRQGAASWIDPTGKFWLFGGDSVFISSVNYRNDLWRFDPATLEWTWISGSSDSGADGVYGRKGLAGPAGGPGARYGAASWADSRGKLWLFGGERGNIDFSDLWQYDPATQYWTWVSGSSSHNQAGIYGTKGIPDPANSPGARHGAAFWIDAGEKLWLASGQAAIGYGGYNDLWHFTIIP
jgi:hypothetical protein